jgi:membrane protein
MRVIREAVAAMWEIPPRPPASVTQLLRDLMSLLALILAVSASVALTVSATGGLGSVLRLAGVADRTSARVLVAVVGVLLGWSIVWGVLVWMLARLPGHALPLRVVGPVAATGAVLIEAITVVTTLAIGATSTSVGGAVFGTALAGLAFLFAVARVLLSLAAWSATAAPPPGSAVAPGAP